MHRMVDAVTTPRCRPPRLIPPPGWHWPVRPADFRLTPWGTRWSRDRDTLLDLLAALSEMGT